MQPTPVLRIADTPPAPIAWLLDHPEQAQWILLACGLISLVLLLRLWIMHRKSSLLTKLFWSVVVFLPLLGWLLYLGLFRPPGYSDIPIGPQGGIGYD